MSEITRDTVSAFLQEIDDMPERPAQMTISKAMYYRLLYLGMPMQRELRPLDFNGTLLVMEETDGNRSEG